MHDPGHPEHPGHPEPPDPWLPRQDPAPPHRPAQAPSDAQARHALGLDPPRYAPGRRDLPGRRNGGPTAPTPADRVRAAIAWSAIVVCVLVLIVLQHVGMKEVQRQAEDDARPGFHALYLGRYAVGLDRLFGGMGAEVLPAFHDATAGSPHALENQTRAAILAAEVAPPQRLTHELDALRLAAESRPVTTPSDAGADDAELVLRIYDAGYTPTADERGGLIERHGWFGEVAATYNLPTTDAAYNSPRRSGTVVVLAIITLMGVVLCALLVGVALLVVFIVMLATRKMALHAPRGPASHRTAYLEATALFLMLFIGFQLVAGLLMVVTDIDMTLVVLLGVIAALAWPLVAGVRWAQFKLDMGYHTGSGLFKEVGLGIAGYVAGLPIVAVGFGMTMVLGLFAEAGGDHPMQYELMDGGYTLWLTLGAAVVWAPLVEESVFRSAFYRHLRQHAGWGGWVLATLVTAFVFAAIHPQGWVGVPVLMSIAIVFAALREWRGTVLPSIVAHALHNGTLCVMMGIILFA